MSKRSEVVYINGAPSTPGYLLALLRELSHVPRGLTEIAQAKQGEWQESDPFLKAANLSKVTLAAIGVRPQ